MVVNECGYCRGFGEIHISGFLWWAKYEPCGACGGDGIAKPPGWPDPVLMARLRPDPPLPPPLPDESATAYMVRTRDCPACGAKAGQPCDGQGSIASVHDERREHWNRKANRRTVTIPDQKPADPPAVRVIEKMDFQSVSLNADGSMGMAFRDLTPPKTTTPPGAILGTAWAETRDPLLPGESVEAYIKRMGGWPPKPETVLKPEGQAFAPPYPETKATGGYFLPAELFSPKPAAPPMPEVPPITVLREDHEPTPENFAADRAAYEKSWPVWGIEYRYLGNTYGLNIPAPTHGEALQMLGAAAAYGKVIGELKGTIPAGPGAGLFVRAFCAVRNWWARL